MKVKTLKDVLHNGVSYPPGKLVEMDKDRAKHLAKKGAVVILENVIGPVITLPQHPTPPAEGTVPEDDREEEEEEEDPVSKEEKPPEKPPQPQTNRATAPGGQRAVAPPAAGGAK